ncbi:MAG: hypothetical protein WCI22_14445 [Actinomycetota bacterium]
MYVEVVAGTSRVRDGENLKALSVRVDDLASLASSLGSLGSVEGDHVWLDIAQLRVGAQSGIAADAVEGWVAGFEGMIGYAAKSGWLNDDGTKVRAHIEP